MYPLANLGDLLVLVSIVLELIIIAWLIRSELRLSRFLQGKSGKSLEDAIRHMSEEIKEANEFNAEAREYFTDLHTRMRGAIRGVETVRFNPFKGTGSGGNQSFATAFINEDGDGVVVSSLYSRDRVSVFSKPIEKFTSSFELSEEEKTVLDKAKNKVLVK